MVAKIATRDFYFLKICPAFSAVFSHLDQNITGLSRPDNNSGLNMADSHKKEEEGDSEDSLEKRGTKWSSNDNEYWIEELAQKLEVGSAKKNRAGSQNTEAEPGTMSQEQIDLAHELCRERFSFADIQKVMGVSEGSVTAYELGLVLMDAEVLIARSLNAQGEYVFEKLHAEIGTKKRQENIHVYDHFQAQDADFEMYDPDRWEAAVEEANVNETLSGEENVAPDASYGFEKVVSESPNPDFVRALKDSKAGSKPYYKEGDILRVINKDSKIGLYGE